MTGAVRPGSAEARIDELEARLAFADDALASLNQALVEQQQRIAALERFVALVLERQGDGQGDPGVSDAEPPPHY